MSPSSIPALFCSCPTLGFLFPLCFPILVPLWGSCSRFVPLFLSHFGFLVPCSVLAPIPLSSCFVPALFPLCSGLLPLLVSCSYFVPILVSLGLLLRIRTKSRQSGNKNQSSYLATLSHLFPLCSPSCPTLGFLFPLRSPFVLVPT